MGFPQALGMFKRLLNREWGHHMARGLLDRLRDFVGSPEVGYPQPDAHHVGPATPQQRTLSGPTPMATRAPTTTPTAVALRTHGRRVSQTKR